VCFLILCIPNTTQVWQALLAVRALVLPPTEDVETWLKFASLCRKSGRISQAKSTLLKLLPVLNFYLLIVEFSLPRVYLYSVMSNLGPYFAV